MNKNCKICLRLIEGVENSHRRYHPECFKLFRKEYQKKYQKTAKGVRFNVEKLKQEVEEIKEIIIKEVLERLKNGNN